MSTTATNVFGLLCIKWKVKQLCKMSVKKCATALGLQATKQIYPSPW